LDTIAFIKKLNNDTNHPVSGYNCLGYCTGYNGWDTPYKDGEDRDEEVLSYLQEIQDMGYDEFDICNIIANYICEYYVEYLEEVYSNKFRRVEQLTKDGFAFKVGVIYYDNEEVYDDPYIDSDFHAIKYTDGVWSEKMGGGCIHITTSDQVYAKDWFYPDFCYNSNTVFFEKI
jgi:hypothetical protein